MPVISALPPEGVREALVDALGDRLRDGPLPGLTGRLKVSAAIPRVAVRGGRRRLRQKRPTIWDFFVLDDAGVALASMRMAKDGPVFAGMRHGHLSACALAAARLAAADLASVHGSFRPVFVESGAAGVFALALLPDRGRGRYIVVLDGKLVEKTALRLEVGIGRLLTHIAERWRPAIDPIGDGAEPGWPPSPGPE